MSEKIGTLSIVATPIGNLEDMTLRAIRTLKESDYILCEDTRVTGKLLKRYEINTPMRRYDAHASQNTHIQTLIDLQEGKHISLVSDAGTPGVSDPGVLLVSRAREAGIRIEAIPGPSAVTTAFSIAGIAGNQFCFLGYAPTKKGRQTFFEHLKDLPQPVVFFESTHRINKTLESLAELYPSAHVCIGRELTKMHEEMISATPQQILEYFERFPEHTRGEFVLIVSI